MNSKPILILCLLMFAATFANAQTRFDFNAGSGINLKRKEHYKEIRSERFDSRANYSLGLSVRSDKKNVLNYGLGVQFTQYHFEDHLYERNATYIPYFEQWNDLSYTGAYLSLKPILDFALDRKGILHCQVSVPIGFKLYARKEIDRFAKGLITEDTSYTVHDNFPAVLPQLSVMMLGNIPLSSKKMWLTLNAGYTGSLGKFTEGATGIIKPSQISFGLGLGYRYLQHKKGQGHFK